MAKMWAGRSSGETDKLADEFNSSIRVDSRMYRQDIRGSIAHAAMLSKCGIISENDANEISSGLRGILADIENGKLSIDYSCEDIHMFVEEELTRRIGDAGKKLHTARSRNDQVALDLRLYLMDETAEITSLIEELMTVLVRLAEDNLKAIMPGYTHLQRAQPILFSHQIMAYAYMFKRDIGRLMDSCIRMDSSPIGCCAFAGTTYETDRRYEADMLGFEDIAMNSIDGVSDRDFCLEMLSALSICMMHMSRLSEELVLWSSWEFKFIELSDRFTTGSSIMPQKKNPDMAELIRGKAGRVYGDLMALLVTMKGLPLAYNKDMQEDKEAVFDAADTLKMCLRVLTPMLETMKVLPENMRKAAGEGFINATDLADYMTRKGLPFREAYRIAGNIVSECIETHCTLEDFPLENYKKHCGEIERDVYSAIKIENCVEKRKSEGGTSTASVQTQIEDIKDWLESGLY